MFAKLHLLSQDVPEGGDGVRWRPHPYLRMAGAVPKGPVVFDWSARQRADLEALWGDPSSEGARERLARDLAVFCDKLGWTPDAKLLEDAEEHGEEYMLTLSAVPPELYLLPWEVIQVGAAGTYLSDYASAQVRYAMPGLGPREIQTAPPAPGVLFAWSSAGGAVPHEEQAAAIRAAAEAGGVTFRELGDVDEARLQAALDAGPPSVLHLLCHGLSGPKGEPSRLAWGASDRPSEITATRLARMLRRHEDSIRLVVLSTCGSGDGRGDPLYMSSLAQELHKKGIPNVVASRYPLSVRGSRVMTRVLYDKLLREAWSLERALRHTRAALFRVDEDGEAHPGDAYGIQLYAYDTEWFVSDNDVQAERPVLASYPFGTATRPVPAREPPAAELTLRMDADPGLSQEELVERLRRVSEDDRLIVAIRSLVDQGVISLVVHTTVDGSQRLLGAWRSKALQLALGVIVGAVILTKGIGVALGGTLSTASVKVTTAAGHVAAASGGTATTSAAVIAGKVVATKLAAVALLGGMVAVGAVTVHARAPEPQRRSSISSQSPLLPEASARGERQGDESTSTAAGSANYAVGTMGGNAGTTGGAGTAGGNAGTTGRGADTIEKTPDTTRGSIATMGTTGTTKGSAATTGTTEGSAGTTGATADTAGWTADATAESAGSADAGVTPVGQDASAIDPEVSSRGHERSAIDAGALPHAVCGNGILEAGEQCDDGNIIDGDGCSRCMREISIDPQALQAQRISGNTDVSPSQETKDSMLHYHLDSVSGTVALCVNADGVITRSTIKDGSGYEEYDNKLVAAVRVWRYRPCLLDGTPAPVCSTVQFVYNLSASPPGSSEN